MAGFSDYGMGMAMRDVIQRIVNEEIEASRPKYRYAVVQSVDRTKRRCSVIFNGETGAVFVNMGAVQPRGAGQTVRVEGIGTDKYITDVMGPAYDQYAPRWGRISPLFTSGNPKVIFDGETNSDPRPTRWSSHWSPEPGDRVVATPLDGGAILQLEKVYNNDVVQYPKFVYLSDSDLGGSWANYNAFGAGYSNVGFSKTISGVVKLKGLIKNGNYGDAYVIFVLPEGFRPLNQKMFVGSTGGNTNAGRIDVYPNGNVVYQSGGGGNNTYASIEDVTFLEASVESALNWITMPLSAPYQNFGAPWPNYAYAKDGHGTVWTRGLLRRTTATPASDSVMASYAAGYRPYRQIHMPWANSGTMGGIHVAPDGGLAQKASSGGISYMSREGKLFMDISSVAESYWTNIPYQGTWTDYNAASFSSTGLVKRSDGLVLLRGLAKRTATDGIVGIIPEGSRPKTDLIFVASSSNAYARVDIQASGSIVARSGALTTWLSLEGISYLAEQ